MVEIDAVSLSHRGQPETVAVPATQDQEDNEPESSKMRLLRFCVIITVAVAFGAVFAFVNWLLHYLIALIVGGFLAFVILFIGYYCLARLLVRSFAFPGSFSLSRRKLEFQYAQQMANEMGKSLNSYKKMLQHFASGARANMKRADKFATQSLVCDHEESLHFIFECSRMKKMVKSYT